MRPKEAGDGAEGVVPLVGVVERDEHLVHPGVHEGREAGEREERTVRVEEDAQGSAARLEGADDLEEVRPEEARRRT